jgi:hypothetical protein
MADKTLTLVKSRQKGRSRFAWLRQFYQNFTQVTDEQVIATLVRFPPNVPTVKTNPAASTIRRIHRRNAPRGNMPNAARARLRTKNPARSGSTHRVFRNIFERDGDTLRKRGRNARPNILPRARPDGAAAKRPRPGKSNLSNLGRSGILRSR